MKNLVKACALLTAVALAIGVVRIACSFCDIVAMVARYNGGRYNWENK